MLNRLIRLFLPACILAIVLFVPMAAAATEKYKAVGGAELIKEKGAAGFSVTVTNDMKERLTVQTCMRANLTGAPGMVKSFSKPKDMSSLSHVEFFAKANNDTPQTELRIAIISKKGCYWWAVNPENRRRKRFRLRFESAHKEGTPTLSGVRAVGFYIYAGWYSPDSEARFLVSDVKMVKVVAANLAARVKTIEDNYIKTIQLIRDLEALIRKADGRNIDVPLEKIALATLKQFIWFERYQIEFVNKAGRLKNQFGRALAAQLPPRKVSPVRSALSCQFKGKELSMLSRIERELKQMLAMGKRAGDGLRKAMKTGGSGYRDAPEYDMSRLKIGKGGFFVGDDPVVLIGPGAFSKQLWFEGDEDLKNFRELGFNHIQAYEIVHSWQVRKKIRQLQRKGVKVDYPKLEDVMFETSSIKVALEKIKQANLSGGFGFAMRKLPWLLTGKRSHHDYNRTDMSDPDLRASISRLNVRMAKRTKDCSNLHLILLAVEDGFRYGLGGTHDRTNRGFRKFLRSRYGNIKALNKRWRTGYKSFGDIVPPTWQLLVKGKRQIDFCLRYDWLRFAAQRNTSMYRQWDKSWSRHNPGCTPVIVNHPVFGYTDLHYTPFYCIDREAQAQTMRVNGFDEHGGDTRYVDFVNCIAPDKPIYNGEFHGTFSNRSGNRRRIWIHFLKGLDGLNLWLWSRSFTSGIGHYLGAPKSLYEVGRSAYEMRSLAKHLIHFPRQADVAVLFNIASYVHYFAHGGVRYDNEFTRLCASAANLDARIAWVTERQIQQGKLKKDYRLLLVPNVNYMEEKTFQRVREFVRNGGIVFATADSFMYDPYLNKRNAGELAKFLGLSRGRVTRQRKIIRLSAVNKDLFRKRKLTLTTLKNAYTFNIKLTTAKPLVMADKPVLTVNQYGRGKVYYLGTPLKMRDMKRLMDAMFDGSRVRRPYRLVDDRGVVPAYAKKREANIFMAAVEQDSRILMGIVAPSGRKWVNLKGFAPSAKMTDALAGRAVGEYNRKFNYHKIPLNDGCIFLIIQRR